MKIKNSTITKRTVEPENSTLSSKRDPLGLCMSRCHKLFLLAFILIMVCGINSVKAQNDTIQIDFGTTASPVNWNFFNSNTLNSTKSALINSKGVVTTVGMKLTGIFTNFNNSGTTNPAASTEFPGTVTVDNIYAGPLATPKYDISGLDPTKEYTFIIFCSRLPADATNREGKFQFIGSTEGICYLNATGNTSNIATATAKPTTEGKINFRISSASGGNVHLNAMKIVKVNPVTCTTSFTEGAQTVCQNASNETYTATTTNSTPVIYSILPAEAGIIDPVTGVMDWNAEFFGTATITATSNELCGTSTADREVIIIPATGPASFTDGAMTICQDAANETYTATAVNSTSIVYSVIPAEAGMIDPVKGIMDWDADFIGTATITSTAKGLCGTISAHREVLVTPPTGPTSFTEGAFIICQDAANEKYTATAANNTPVVYSVLPAEAGVIDPVTGIMDWDADFFGTAIITATSTMLCGTTTADREVTVNPPTGPTSFTEGAMIVCQDTANEKYTATAANSTPVIYSVFPAEAGIIDPVSGIMDWDANFYGTATITATYAVLCGTTTADRKVTVTPPTGPTSFTKGALTVDLNAANETYTAMAANSTSVVYSVLPAEAGVIDPVTGMMDWNADFFGTATVKATSAGLCGISTADREVTVNSTQAQTDTIQIDLGGTTSVPKWNALSNFNVGTTPTLLTNTKGEATTVGIRVTGKFNAANSAGTKEPDPVIGFPGSVTFTNFYASRTSFAAVELSGLDPNKEYTFLVFGSIMKTDTDIREGKFLFIGSEKDSCLLNATNNASNVASAKVKPSAEGIIKVKCTTGPNNTNGGGNFHLSDMKIIKDNQMACKTTFIEGAVTVCPDAANETYKATTTNNAPIVYSVLPAEAGMIDPVTGIMDWDANFSGTATITASSDESCGASTADRIVMVNPATTFTAGATTVLQDATNETYTAIAANSTSIVYSALPAEAGVIDPATGVMDWDAEFFGTATITATAEGLCGTTTADRVVMVTVKSDEAQSDTIQVDFGSIASPSNWNYYNTIAVGTNKTNMINSKGVATTVGMMITTGFGGINTTATSTPDPSTGFPGTVTADNFYVGAGGTPEFEISGLDPTKDYTFIIFASRMPADANAREGKYQFTGSTEGISYLNATGNTSNIATATARPTEEGRILFKISQTGAGNVHLNAMKIVQVNQVDCNTSFTEGAQAVSQDAANETYKAITTNNAPIVYSVFPADAGVIDPTTGVMDWNAAFFGTATITATSSELCGSTTADRVVAVNKPTGTELNSHKNISLVFPNPTKDNINIQVSELSQVKIFDITGKVLLERLVEAGNNKINLNLKSGIYMVRVNGAKKAVYTTKLIVE